MSGEPVYRQLAVIIRSKIASGEYPPGAPLPSAKSMAQEYGISVGAVNPRRGCHPRGRPSTYGSRPWRLGTLALVAAAEPELTAGGLACCRRAGRPARTPPACFHKPPQVLPRNAGRVLPLFAA